MGVSVAVALVGTLWAVGRFSKRPELGEPTGFGKVLANKWYVDELYDRAVVKPLVWLSRVVLWKGIDQGVIDGAGVNGVGLVTRIISRISMWWDKWIVDGLVNVAARFVGMLSYPTRILQSGKVSGYALMIVAGLISLLWYYLHLVRLPGH